ncbi:Uncharacterised protein [Mycoplasmopsis gallopavonis]|uniref:Uncharacterized protein n=1 Tax=Mycoplasmopsis gallopavonis TaxID=76629 RepID=A0A449AZG6_9BACT|nr:hypothetical protein [Mycoplasmopsis gallopavonis]VEU72891.1 Uncharacterised protein [Mycoplasmopsis gallopavonis]
MSDKEFKLYTCRAKKGIEVESFFYDINGKEFESQKGKGLRPLVIFECQERIFFLTFRSQNNRKGYVSEILFKIKNSKNLDNDSYLECKNIHIMERKKFFQIFDESSKEELTEELIEELIGVNEKGEVEKIPITEPIIEPIKERMRKKKCK